MLKPTCNYLKLISFCDDDYDGDDDNDNDDNDDDER